MDERRCPVDEEKLSPVRPQAEPGFAQAIPKLITRPGDNFFTRISDTAGTCAVYAQKLSPAVHRVWESRAELRGYVPNVAFASYGHGVGSMETLVDYLERSPDDTPTPRRKDRRGVIGEWSCTGCGKPTTAGRR